jgi:2-oxoglutarate-Fe(II)-dependent dioxygenase family protein
MSDEPRPVLSGLYERIWDSLSEQGYALTSLSELGLAEKFGENFQSSYFVEGIIRHDDGDWPVDRLRARDVVYYEWDENGDPSLEEYEQITITDRADIPGERNHSRIRLLADPQAREFIDALLRMVPPDRRDAQGTMGINLFRTFTNVVTKPHRDDERYIITCVLDRVGEGAETYLYLNGEEDPAHGEEEPAALRHQLDPGQVIIFDDELFRHGATPLVAPPGETARRDAVICTIDYRETYLGKETVSSG